MCLPGCCRRVTYMAWRLLLGSTDVAWLAAEPPPEAVPGPYEVASMGGRSDELFAL